MSQARQQMEELAAIARDSSRSSEERQAAMAEIDKIHARYVESGEQASDMERKEKESYFGQLAEAYEKRKMVMTDIFEAHENGEQGYAESAMQAVGKVGVGAFFDLVGISTMEGIKAVTPDALEDEVKNKAGAAWAAFVQTDVGQEAFERMSQGVEAYAEFKENSPRAARNVEAGVNIATALVPAPLRKGFANLWGKSKRGDKLRKSADDLDVANIDKHADEFVRPPKGVKENVRRVEEGMRTDPGAGEGIGRLFRSSRDELSIRETRAKEAVKGVIDPRESTLHNVNRVKGEIKREAAAISQALKKNDVVYDQDILAKRLAALQKRLLDEPGMGKDTAKGAKEVIKSLEKILAAQTTHNVGGKTRRSLADLFEARKELDNAYRKIGRGPEAGDPGTYSNGMARGLRAVRREVNEMVDDLARPGTKVKDSLKRQTALYDALDAATPKAAAEGANKIFRAWHTATGLLPFRSQIINVLAAGTGLGGLGAAAAFAPAFTTVAFSGGAAYGMYRLAASPGGRRALAAMADTLKKAGDTGKFTAAQLAQIRADRAGILELLKDTTHADVDDTTPGEAIVHIPDAKLAGEED